MSEREVELSMVEISARAKDGPDRWQARYLLVDTECRRLEASNERLRVALTANQWGSCDGCSNGHNYCSECKAPRLVIDDSGDAAAGRHLEWCSIAAALTPDGRVK